MAKFKYWHRYTEFVIKHIRKLIKKYFTINSNEEITEFFNKLIDKFWDKSDNINKKQFEKYLIENNYPFTLKRL